MPMIGKDGKVRKKELPSTLRRSRGKAQRTFAEAHDAASKQYGGDEERAYRVAFAALKHTHEKVGDHWERKAGGRKGPSDGQAAGGVNTHRQTAEGVDTTASKTHLRDLARRLQVAGRSTMTKAQLVEAIRKANRRVTARAR